MEARVETTRVEVNCSSISNEMSLTGKFCRICFEIETKEVPLIYPCDCNGSMKYIHEDCLKKWIVSRGDDPASFACDICKTSLAMVLDLNLKFSCKQLKNELFKMIVYPILISVISTIIILIFMYLCSPENTSKISTGAKVYLAVVMATCFSIDAALIGMLFKSFKVGCFQNRVLSWTILNRKQKENETTDIIEITGNIEEKVGKIVRVRSFDYFDENNYYKETNIHPVSFSERIIRRVHNTDFNSGSSHIESNDL